MIGDEYDRLVVIEEYPLSDWSRHKRWVCLCECGKIVIVKTHNLTSGNTRSCGCLRRDILKKRWADRRK